MKAKLFPIVVSIIISASPLAAQQRFFFFEQRNPFKHSVKLPRAVLDVMRYEIQNRRGCTVTESTDLSRWFFGSRINLAPDRRAYILRSHQDCLNGADNDWVWVVLKTSRGYRMVFFDGTISVYVRSSRSQGLRDLETNAATAAIAFRDVFQFDGKMYKRTQCFEAMPVEAKLKSVPCDNR